MYRFTVYDIIHHGARPSFTRQITIPIIVTKQLKIWPKIFRKRISFWNFNNISTVCPIFILLCSFLQTLLGEHDLTVCWFCVCVWDNFLASDWSKLSDVARHQQVSYDVARPLLMVPTEPWQNSTPVFDRRELKFCQAKPSQAPAPAQLAGFS